jgi:UDP-glucuronate 4-epimerase
MKRKQSKKTILVTGGAGFIGAHVAKKLLEEGFRVVCVDSFNKYYDPSLKRARAKYLLKGAHVYACNIADFKKLKKIFGKEKVDTICHLAAQAGVRYSLENPFVYEEANLRGTINLLELAKDCGVKNFVFASSSSVYGERSNSPFLETDRTDEPVSLYAATKKATEVLAYSYHENYGLNCTGLRFFTVYGPWGRPDMALFKFTKNIIDGRPIEIYNRGDMRRDFTYIDDIVSGVVAAIKKPFSWEVFNLSFGEPVKLVSFVDMLEKTIGKKAMRKLMPKQRGDVLQTYGSNKKAKKMLSFKPQTSIEDGVQKFVDWYRWYYKV